MFVANSQRISEILLRFESLTMPLRTGEGGALKPFITCKECADLIGVTPEHLCGMRARGEGPPWSGAGKWTRYERRAVLTWLASLPREKNSSPSKCFGFRSLKEETHG